jgi:hypothetical protein
MSTKALRGYVIKDGKVCRVAGYGLDASAKIRQRTSKKVRVIKRATAVTLQARP